MKYTVVSLRTDETPKRTIKDFIEEVNILIKEGWIPQGGVCTGSYEGGVYVFYQALIKN